MAVLIVILFLGICLLRAYALRSWRAWQAQREGLQTAKAAQRRPLPTTFL